MAEHPLVEQYLTRLERALSGASRQERDEVLTDIRGHITEAMAAGSPVEDVLAALGPVDQLARAYAAEIPLHPAAPRLRLPVFRRAPRSVNELPEKVVRLQRRSHFMDTLRQDVRFGVRLLWKDKGFTAAAVLTLALCLGANAALFSVVHNVLLKPLAFPHPEQLVYVYDSFPNAGAERAGASVVDYYDRLRSINVFQQQALYTLHSRSINAADRPQQVDLMEVTPSFFPLLQVAPVLGRTFTPEEGKVGQEHEVVLSYATWQELYGGRKDVIGKALRISDVPYTIVGVMPRTFSFMEPDVRAWVPAAFTDADKAESSRFSESGEYVARLKAGATVAQAQAQLDALNAANYQRFPQWQTLLEDAGFNVIAVPLERDMVRDVRTMLYLLWGGALFVLLLGAINVANLTLVRSRVRLREMMTRAALGAGRLRLARQIVTESLVVSVASALGALFLGYAGLRAFGLLNLQELPRGADIHLDGTTVAVVLALSAAVGVLISAIPALSIFRTDVAGVFREDVRTGTAGRGTRTLRRLLVATQIAVAFVLLVGAGLLLASFQRVLAADPGFNPARVLTASVRLPPTRYGDHTAVAAFANQALVSIRALPGVVRAGATDSIPLSDNYGSSVIEAEGYHPRPSESVLSPLRSSVSPGYFEALQIALVKGRFFTDRDTADAPGVIIIDQRLAQHFWPDQNPIGRRMYMPTSPDDLTVTPRTKFLTVVGVVHNVAASGVDRADKLVGAYYFPIAQAPQNVLTFTIRTEGDPSSLINSVRRTVANLDPQLPLYDIETMVQRTNHALVNRRSPLMLSIGFGAVALFLSAIGIYGVLAYLVAQRRKEIGIRIALGSSSRQVFRMILREGLVVLAVGFAIGLIGALAMARTLQSQLYGVVATDPRVLTAATVLLALVALVACLVPAGRAARVDPVIALRQE
jgi:predicted permease